MLELILLILGVACLGLLVRPAVRRWTPPAWWVRARARRRPGIPITAWLAALLLMELIWLIGEQRNVLSFFAMVIWFGAPLTAAWITWYWLKRSDQQ